MNDTKHESTNDLPDVRYSHPSHAEFNAKLAAEDEPTPHDVLADWSPSQKLPNLRRDFAQLNTYLQPRSHLREQDNTDQQRGSHMVEVDHLAPTLVPPPNIRDPVDRAHFNQKWLLEARNAVLAHAVIPQRKQEHSQTHQQFNHHSGESSMTDQINTQNSNAPQLSPTPNAPLETFKDGAAVIKLWQQEGRDGHIHVNASVGRLYKDNETGQWKESKSFSPSDLSKLGNMMPRALAHASAHEHNLNVQRQEQIAAHAQAQQQTLTATRPDQIVTQQNMIAQRDAVLSQSRPAQATQTNTQEHVQTQNHEPS